MDIEKIEAENEVVGAVSSEQTEPSSTEPSSTEPSSTGLGAEDTLTDVDPKQIIEALLFVTKSPLSIVKLCAVSQIEDKDQVQSIVTELIAEYEEAQKPYHIVKLATGYQILTRPEFAPWLINMYKKRREEKLTQTSLETLAIIVYKQPIIRAAIESIRGVSCDYPIRTLMERDLIKVVGREDSLGRPMQYGSTKKFLDYFGLSSTKDLPRIEDIGNK